MQKYLLFLMFLLSTCFSLANRVGFSSEKWLILQTQHFDILHSAEQQDLSLYYAEIAETAYAHLSAVFSTHPDKITIVLNDSTDSSNGYATVLPYPLIMVYPVQISNQETLSESGEWARELLTHEMTHIFQMYPSKGVYNWLRPIFGTIVSPNLITPSWWKEGMAIEMETRFSPQGRSRSDLQSATLRSLTNDHLLSEFTLAEANEVLKTWPYGNRPYFFGSMIMSEIAQDGGLTAINHIVERQSERAPYFIEAPVKESLDRTYQDEFNKAMTEQIQRATKQIEKLKTKPLSEGFTVDDSLLSSRHPRFNETKKILGLVGLKKTGPEIIFYQWNESEKKYIQDAKQKRLSGTIGTFEFHPHAAQIIFSKIDAVNSKQDFSDLYIYDLQTQIEKRLTHSERAREPVFSDDGSHIVYIKTANGRTEVKILDLATEKSESIFISEVINRTTQAIFIDANELLINQRMQNGEQKLSTLNLKTKSTTQIQTSHRQIRFIKKYQQKIYFTDTANGVANVYSTNLNNPKTKFFKETFPETHLLTGTSSFDISDTQLIIGAIGSAGFKVQELNHKLNSGKNLKLPVIENEIAARYQFKESAALSVDSTQVEYTVWPKVLPHYWIPFVGTSSTNKGYLIQAQTSGQDPLNQHNYQANLNYETYLEKMGFNFIYLNSVFDWQVAASAKQTQKSYGTLTTTILQKNSYALGILPDVFKISPDLVVNFGAQFDQTDDSILVTEHAGGYLQTTYKTFEQKVFQYYPMSGWGTSLIYENMKAQKNLGPLLDDYSQLAGTLTGYFSKWLPEDHALMFKIDGIYTFENVSSRFGTSNTQFPILADGLITQFALRGYSAGQFFGSQLLTGTAEYRLPIKNIHKGSGTDPLFIKTLTAAVIVDGLATKGFGVNEFNKLVPTTLSEQYWNAGLEARLSTTIGYFIPMNFILGYYMPFSPTYAKSGQIALSLQLGGL